ncbi:alpha/beta hydrolase-fold protein [Lacibacter sp. MH-610]|uniref:alpha/beta hydrolase n=1 Tax=Lacibacter sp. MH-610 TaxID=3020883 RepID=UPI003891EBC2
MKYIFLLLCLVSTFQSSAQLPVPSSGKIIRHDSFASQFVTARNVDVWLPQGYSPKKKYAVLYMHDGQMLYDSSLNWNKQEWGVDETITRLMKEKKIKDVIVVGVWNGGKYRHTDYFPQKPFEHLTQQERDTLYYAKRTNGALVFQGEKVHSDLYLKFLVTELKPFIDKTYSTKTDRANTFIGGSSMGGLISMYAICEYPDVFGGAACLSTHWPGVFSMDDNPVPAVFMNYLRNHLPSPATHKIYFDYGDATLDALYPPLQKMADEIMKEKGFTASNWITKYFPGEDHSENAWQKRLDIPLLFLLKR